MLVEMLEFIVNFLKKRLNILYGLIIFWFVICIFFSSINIADSQNFSTSLSVSSNKAGLNQKINFNANISGLNDTTNTSYKMDFGDGIIKRQSTPSFSHSYSKYGLYTVTLTVSNDFGSSTSYKDVHIVPEKPIAYLKTDVDSHDVIAGVTEITFSAEESIDTDLSSASLLFNFDFGDGTESGWQQSAFCRHVYDAKGLYQASVIVKNQSEVESEPSERITVNVLSSLRAEIFVNPRRSKDVEVEVTVDVSDSTDLNTGNKIVKYAVDFGDGSPVQTSENITKFSHVYASSGSFKITLTVTNDKGETASATTVIKLGTAYLFEMIRNGAIVFGIIVPVIIFFLGLFKQEKLEKTIKLAFIFLFKGSIIGALVGLIWWFIGYWTLIIILGIFIFYILPSYDVSQDGKNSKFIAKSSEEFENSSFNKKPYVKTSTNNTERQRTEKQRKLENLKGSAKDTGNVSNRRELKGLAKDIVIVNSRREPKEIPIVDSKTKITALEIKKKNKNSWSDKK